MKRYQRRTPSNTVIKEAIESGTTYYVCEREEVLNALDQNKSNIILREMIRLYGLRCLNTASSLFGSIVVGDTLYLCVTDGRDININGDFVDPEKALLDYTIEELSRYIQPATNQIIQRYITGYELKPFRVDDVAKRMLEHYSFTALASAAVDIGLIK